jgi:hypothetical protein
MGSRDALSMNDGNSLIEHRWVKVICDYCAWGVWDRDGLPREASELPIEPALVERIEAWQALYETLPVEMRVTDWSQGARFLAEGLAIARAVKAALPDWTVIYVDEAALDAAVAEGDD